MADKSVSDGIVRTQSGTAIQLGTLASILLLGGTGITQFAALPDKMEQQADALRKLEVSVGDVARKIDELTEDSVEMKAWRNDMATWRAKTDERLAACEERQKRK